MWSLVGSSTQIHQGSPTVPCTFKSRKDIFVIVVERFSRFAGYIGYISKCCRLTKEYRNIEIRGKSNITFLITSVCLKIMFQ